MTTDTIHTCSYECERPECIRAQRDELAERLTAAQPPASDCTCPHQDAREPYHDVACPARLAQQPADVDGSDAQAAEIEALRAEAAEAAKVLRGALDASTDGEPLRVLANRASNALYWRTERAERAEARAERLAEALRELSEVCRAAIKAGDWKVDGACDPDSLLSRADAAIDQARGKGIVPEAGKEVGDG